MRVCAVQDHAQQRADQDLKIRVQAEAHGKKEKSLAQEAERAKMNVTSVYMSSRATHVAAKRAIDEVADVEQHVQLAKGAVERVGKVAREALAAAPLKKRAKLERELARPSMTLSACQHALSMSRKHAGSELARAVKHTRESQISVYKDMGFC